MPASITGCSIWRTSVRRVRSIGPGHQTGSDGVHPAVTGPGGRRSPTSNPGPRRPRPGIARACCPWGPRSPARSGRPPPSRCTSARRSTRSSLVASLSNRSRALRRCVEISRSPPMSTPPACAARGGSVSRSASASAWVVDDAISAAAFTLDTCAHVPAGPASPVATRNCISVSAILASSARRVHRVVPPASTWRRSASDLGGGAVRGGRAVDVPAGDIAGAGPLEPGRGQCLVHAASRRRLRSLRRP